MNNGYIGFDCEFRECTILCKIIFDANRIVLPLPLSHHRNYHRGLQSTIFIQRCNANNENAANVQWQP